LTPPSIRVRSFAKINLALSVLGRRDDGYHEIRTVLQSIDLCDELVFESDSEIRLRCTGLDSVQPRDNLVFRAAESLRRATATRHGADIFLKKSVPSGAGLGGGSSNAAATLLALARLWGLSVPMDDLCRIAAQLGSDVPFFLTGGTALGVGRGQEIHPLPEWPETPLVVIYPGTAISTAEAYRSLKLELTSADAASRIERFCGQAARTSTAMTPLFNDFETSILPAYPAVREAREFLAEHGATAVLLSGSGSAVFGFFSDEESALAVSRMPMRGSWRAFPAKTLSRSDYHRAMFG